MRTKAAKNGLQGKCGTFNIFDIFILKIITFFCKKHFAFDHDWQSPHKKNPGKMEFLLYFLFMNKIFQEIGIYKKETLMLNSLKTYQDCYSILKNPVLNFSVRKPKEHFHSYYGTAFKSEKNTL